MPTLPTPRKKSNAWGGPIQKAIGESKPPFVIHVGDFKSGGEACTDTLIEKRRDQIYGLLPDRVFYTPGDNEWTDCDRSSLGNQAASELERLDFLREAFFDEPIAAPKNWAYARQPNFHENARWMVNGVMFVTVHFVSTNNGRVEILEDDIEAALALVEARDQANRVWLDEAFSEARKQEAAAIVIATQADPTNADGVGPCCCGNVMNCDAFERFREQLRWNAAKFRDRGCKLRPVLLIHGDTNPYCWDEGFGGPDAPNLKRLNVWGDFKCPGDATVVRYKPGKDHPFDVVTLLEATAPETTCR